jgi:hypothetical protein
VNLPNNAPVNHGSLFRADGAILVRLACNQRGVV